MLKKLAIALVVAATAGSAYTLTAAPAEAQGWRNQANDYNRGARREFRRDFRRDTRNARQDHRRDWRRNRHNGPGYRQPVNRYHSYNNNYRVYRPAPRYPVGHYDGRRYNRGHTYYAPRRRVVVYRDRHYHHGPGPLGWLIRGIVRDLTR